MQKQQLFLVILAATTLTVNTAAFAGAKQEQFIKTIKPSVKKANQQIAQKRQRLKNIYAHYQKKHNIKQIDKQWLNQLAKQYHIHIPDWSQQQTWDTLLKRVDIIPSSLTIAQAALESAWGQSRFAKQGHNYFGQHCYQKGCGLVPKRRASHRSFEVRKFKSPLGSVKSYIHNLNTGETYKQLREIRAKQRRKNQQPSGYAMAAGLKQYSQSPTYIKNIRSIIQQYDLNQN